MYNDVHRKEPAMNAMNRIGNRMTPDEVYRRAELAQYSDSLDRDLRQLAEADEIRKLWRGVYYRPRVCFFGKSFPEFKNVLAAFLKDDDFFMTSLNVYNSMRVGTTQLYNEHLVYTNKLRGRRNIVGQNFFFMNRKFPKEPTLEFYYVDLINNLEMLAEEQDLVRKRAVRNIFELGIDKVRHAAHAYGKATTIKFFDQLYQNGGPGHGEREISASAS